MGMLETTCSVWSSHHSASGTSQRMKSAGEFEAHVAEAEIHVAIGLAAAVPVP